MAGISFEQLRISGTVANAGLESYSDGGTPGYQRVAVDNGIARLTSGIGIDPTGSPTLTGGTWSINGGTWNFGASASLTVAGTSFSGTAVPNADWIQSQIATGINWKFPVLIPQQLDSTNDGLNQAVAFYLDGTTTAGDTFVISDGTPETWTGVNGAAGANQFSVDTGANEAMDSLATRITADSSKWGATVATALNSINDGSGSSSPGRVLVIYRKDQAAASYDDRIYSSGANNTQSLWQYVNYNGEYGYTRVTSSELPSADPTQKEFGPGTQTTDLLPGEAHVELDGDSQYVWDADGGVWQQISGTGSITAGTGLAKTGDTIHIGASGTLGNVGGITRTSDDIAVAPGAGIQVASNLVTLKPYASQVSVAGDSDVNNNPIYLDATNGVNIKIDDSTIGLDVGNSYRLFVKNAGITQNQIASSSLSTGLTGGSGSAIAIDTNSTVNFSSSTPVWTFGNETTAEGLFITGTPVDATHAVNKEYVDAIASGLDLKESTQAATTGILDANTDISGAPTFSPNTGTNSAGLISATLAVSGVFAVDGVALASNDRLLVKNEEDGTQAVNSITARADSGGDLNNTRFYFFTMFNRGFYVWFNVAGGGSDPGAPVVANKSFASGIEVAIGTNATNTQVAAAVKAAIDAFAIDDRDGHNPTVGLSGGSSEVITITNFHGGIVPTIAVDTSGFTSPTEVTPGTGLSPSANGIWIVTITGTALTLNRADDFDGSPSGEVSGGSFTFVEEGTLYDNTGWVVTKSGTIIVGGVNSQCVQWTQFSGAGAVTAGDGLTQSGSTINLGNNGTGTFSGLTIGANTVAVALEAAGAGTGGLAFDNEEIRVDAGDGIVLNANGVSVNLEASNPSLQISTNELGIKFNASGGLEKLAAGTGIKLDPNGGSGSGLALSANGLIVDTNDGIGLDSSGVKVNASTAAGAQQYGGLVVNRTSDGTATATAGLGYIAVQTDNSTLAVNASNQVVVRLLGVDTAQLAANAVTIAKLGIQFNEVTVAASAFTSADPSVSPTLSPVALVDSNGYGYVELYRNGVADMNKNAPATSMAGAGVDEYKITADGQNVEIGANISASGHTFRLRYLSAL